MYLMFCTDCNSFLYHYVLILSHSMKPFLFPCWLDQLVNWNLPTHLGVWNFLFLFLQLLHLLLFHSVSWSPFNFLYLLKVKYQLTFLCCYDSIKRFYEIGLLFIFFLLFLSFFGGPKKCIMGGQHFSRGDFKKI